MNAEQATNTAVMFPWTKSAWIIWHCWSPGMEHVADFIAFDSWL